MTTTKIPSTEQDGIFNVMFMGRNRSSLAWMTTTTKISSTEQDGVFNVMSMGRNWSSLAWMTTLLHNSVADVTYIYMHTG
jgi:hypothetical protein